MRMIEDLNVMSGWLGCHTIFAYVVVTKSRTKTRGNAGETFNLLYTTGVIIADCWVLQPCCCHGAMAKTSWINKMKWHGRLR